MTGRLPTALPGLLAAIVERWPGACVPLLLVAGAALGAGLALLGV